MRWNFYFNGVQICMSTWANFHGISRRMVTKACKMAKKDNFKDSADIDLYLSTELRRSSSFSERADIVRGFFREYGDLYGEHMPHDDDSTNPADNFAQTTAESKTNGGADEDSDGVIRLVHRDIGAIFLLYAEFSDRLKVAPFSMSHFRNVWKTSPDLHKYKRARLAANFGICADCERFKRELLNTKMGSDERAKVKKEFASHLEQMKNQRAKYEKHKEKSRMHPETYLSVCLDCMTHKATTLPHPGSSRLAKDLNSKERFGSKLQGIIFHGRGTHFYSAHDGLSQGSNFTVECLHSALMTELQEIEAAGAQRPSVLYVQADNVTDNKSHVLIDYAALLVRTGVFKKVKIGFLKPGHTHIDIDQCFSVINRNLKKTGTDAFTISRFKTAIQTAWKCHTNRPKVVCFLNVIHDWRKLLETKCEKFGRYGCSEKSGEALHCFILRLCKRTGSVLMYYKRWPTDEFVRPMPYSHGKTISVPDSKGERQYRYSSSFNKLYAVVNVTAGVEGTVQHQQPVPRSARNAGCSYVWKVSLDVEGGDPVEFEETSPGIKILDGGASFSLSDIEVEVLAEDFVKSLPKIEQTIKFIFEDPSCSMHPSIVKYPDAMIEWVSVFDELKQRIKTEEKGPLPASVLPLPTQRLCSGASSQTDKSNACSSSISQVDVMTGMTGKGDKITSSSLASTSLKLTSSGRTLDTLEVGMFGLAQMGELDEAAQENVKLANYTLSSCVFRVLSLESPMGKGFLSVQWFHKPRCSSSSGIFRPWIIVSKGGDIRWTSELPFSQIIDVRVEMIPSIRKEKGKPPADWTDVKMTKKSKELTWSRYLAPPETPHAKKRRNADASSDDSDDTDDESNEGDNEDDVSVLFAGTRKDTPSMTMPSVMAQVKTVFENVGNIGLGQCFFYSFGCSRVSKSVARSSWPHRADNSEAAHAIYEAGAAAREGASSVYNRLANSIQEILDCSGLHPTQNAAEIKSQLVAVDSIFQHLLVCVASCVDDDVGEPLKVDRHCASGQDDKAWEDIRDRARTFFDSSNAGDARDAISFLRTRAAMHMRESANARLGESTSARWEWANCADVAAVAVHFNVNIWCIREPELAGALYGLQKFPFNIDGLWDPEIHSRGKRPRKKTAMNLSPLADHIGTLIENKSEVVILWARDHFTALLPRDGDDHGPLQSTKKREGGADKAVAKHKRPR